MRYPVYALPTPRDYAPLRCYARFVVGYTVITLVTLTRCCLARSRPTLRLTVLRLPVPRYVMQPGALIAVAHLFTNSFTVTVDVTALPVAVVIYGYLIVGGTGCWNVAGRDLLR